jgi:hypothetical protein
MEKIGNNYKVVGTNIVLWWLIDSSMQDPYFKVGFQTLG